MASEDIIVYLDAMENTVNMIRGDGSDKRTLFSTGCACPDGIALGLSNYRDTRDPKDIVVWWGNMGPMKPSPGRGDGGDWHEADGFLSRGMLLGGDVTVQRVEVTAPRHLVCGTAEYRTPGHHPLITTVKQLCITHDENSIFFCDREGHGLKKYNVSTGEVVLLLSSDALAPPQRATPGGAGASSEGPHCEEECRFCVGVALDERRDQIVFTLKGPPKGGKGRLLTAPYGFRRRNLPSNTAAKTSVAEGVIDPQTAVSALESQPEPVDLLLDAEESYLYWTDRGDPKAGGNSLNRCFFSHDYRTGQLQLGGKELVMSGFDEPIGLGWAASLWNRIPLPASSKETLRKYMYVTDKCHLWRCDLQSGTKVSIFDCSPHNRPTGLVVLRFI
ncbi:hypothetical protein LSCM1_05542 [Leishmania martiniquensis]|uniref:Uncharacterized protein n=1 Tax=Leishmania martiniquensis TaxID=1580590 RepID=A0A836GYL4_9TRYP|nr:hypothetical protein LSCM1_05542 [Leishmania martiniquensis]